MNPLDDLQTLWHTADVAPPAPAPDLREQAADLDRTLRRRDFREIGAAAAVSLFFGVVALLAPRLLGPSLGMIAAAAWVTAVIVGVRMAVPRASPWAPLREAVAAEHRWLASQVTLLRWAWLWYVLPLAVAAVAFYLAVGGGSLVYPVLVAAGSVALGWANWKAADDLATTRDAFAAHLHALTDSDA